MFDHQPTQLLPLKHTADTFISHLLSHYGKLVGFSLIDTEEAHYIFLSPVSFEHFPPRTSLTEILKPAEAMSSPVPATVVALPYEVLHQLERVPRVPAPARVEPVKISFRDVIIVQRGSSDALVYHHEMDGNPLWTANLSELRKIADSPPTQTAPSCPNASISPQDLSPYSNFTKDAYLAAIEEIKEAIRDGDVYQVNLSQQFKVPCPLPSQHAIQLLRTYDRSPRSAFIQLDTGTILSMSPELFFRAHHQQQRLVVECKPIKGTRARGTDATQDNDLAKELLASEKDKAELAMIVDLMRNDLHRISPDGEVEVSSHAALESFATVHHLVSTVRTNLAPQTPCSAICEALFPCGSITGAPKIAAMNYISRVERTPRGYWTGCIGWLATDHSAHFNVAIRTGFLRNGLLTFNSGGGITIDSDPAAEHEETLIKSRCWLPIFSQPTCENVS